MRREQRSSRRRKIVLLAALGLGALSLGWLLGSAGTSPAPAGDRDAAVVASTGADSTATVAGVPVGFPRSAEGAATAVAAYQRAFASPSILRPGVLEKRVQAVTTPDYAMQMIAANVPGRDRIAGGPIGQGLLHGTQTIYSAVPIGYRIESFSPDRARILTWGFTLLGNADTVEPAAYFGIAHTLVVWREGRWEIAETRAGFGPTPKLATAPGPLGGYDVIDLAKKLKSYALAP